MQKLSDIPDALDMMADLLEQQGVVASGTGTMERLGPFTVGQTRYRLTVEMSPGGLRERAEKFRRQMRADLRSAGAAAYCAERNRRDVQRPRRPNPETLTRFERDDEHDNAAAYRALFDV